MYFAPPSAIKGPLLGHLSTPIRGASALALVLVLATLAAPRPAAAVVRLLPPEPAPMPAKSAVASTSDDGSAVSKPRKPTRRAADKVTPVSTAKAEKLTVPAPAPVPAAGGERWDIVISDRTLNAAMARWAAAAGWQLLWELPIDYAVQAHTSVPGKFEDAVTLVVNSMEGAEIPMKAVFYSGNKVLRITAKGTQ